MNFKSFIYAVSITTHIMGVVTLPTAAPIDLRSISHPHKRELGVMFVRAPEDIPVEECKRALLARPISDEALYRRCAGEGEGEEDSGIDGDTEEGGNNDDDDRNIDDVQIASNSPRQACILTQMGLFPMPDFGLCESLPDTPPTPNAAPPVTSVPSPITPQPQPQPQPEPAPAPAPPPLPARKPVPVDADDVARAIAKRDIGNRDLEEVMT